jgi:protein disulfide-isomerase A6
MNKLLIFVLLAIAIHFTSAAGAGGFYGANSAVITLTKSNFAQKVINDDHVWIIEFYAPWC